MQIAPPLQRCEANSRRPTKLTFISHFLDKRFLRMPATLRSYRKQLVKILSEGGQKVRVLPSLHTLLLSFTCWFAQSMYRTPKE